LVSDLQLYWELWNETEAEDRKQRIFDSVHQKTALPKRAGLLRLRRWMPYAAALLLASMVGLLLTHQPKHAAEPIITAQDIMPGGSRATLTLADGRTIDLNADQSGIIVGNDITYMDGAAITNGTSSYAPPPAASQTPLLTTD